MSPSVCVKFVLKYLESFSFKQLCFCSTAATQLSAAVSPLSLLHMSIVSLHPDFNSLHQHSGRRVRLLCLRKEGIEKQCCSRNHAWTRSAISRGISNSSLNVFISRLLGLKQVLSHPWILLPRQRPSRPRQHHRFLNLQLRLRKCNFHHLQHCGQHQLRKAQFPQSRI